LQVAKKNFQLANYDRGPGTEEIFFSYVSNGVLAFENGMLNLKTEFWHLKTEFWLLKTEFWLFKTEF
jgi:hypothetical protein